MIAKEARGLVLAIVAATGSALLLAGVHTPGLMLWVAAWAYVAWRMLQPVRKGRWARPVASFGSVRLILLSGLAGPLVDTADAPAPEHAWAGWSALVFLAVLTRTEGLIRRLVTYQGFRVANLPGLEIKVRTDRPLQGFVLGQLIVPAALLAMGTAGISGLYWALPLALLAACVLWMANDARERRRWSRAAQEEAPEALEALQPQFVVHWDAPRRSGYELAMWIPYFQRIGLPFFIMVRSIGGFNEAVRLCEGSPVVMARSLAELERMVVPSLRAAFYVNNGAKNSHLVRYIDLTHVQLLHGESDKPASFNPVTAMFDKVFVAGQAGMDRYANNGVSIPAEKFEIVGRPQVEGIDVQGVASSSGEPPENASVYRDPQVTTVLYAPTWRGHQEVASYSSIPVVLPLFDALIARGVRIVFRPHPLTYKDPEYRALVAAAHERLEADNRARGIGHLFGEIAEEEMSLVDCFNASDALIADISGVIADYLYSRKPFAVMNGGRGAEEFAQEFPLSLVGYVMSPEPEGWADVLTELLDTDPDREKRLQAREHYLGPFPDETYVDAFVRAARKIALGEQSAGSASRDTSSVVPPQS